MAWFCGPCSFCQELRSVDPATWDWLSEIKGKGVKPMVQPIKCFRE